MTRAVPCGYYEVREDTVQHLVGVDDLGRDGIERLLDLAGTLESRGVENAPPVLTGAIVALVFAAPSVRTRSSFQAAALRLGGQVLDISGPQGLPYAAEALADVLQSIDLLCNLLVVRHTWSPTVEELAALSRVPLVNAGLMCGEHPTQTLADLYTLRQAFGSFQGLRLGLVAEDAQGREVTSLRRAILHFPEIAAVWYGPDDEPVDDVPARRPIAALAEDADGLSAIYVTPSTRRSVRWSQSVAAALHAAVEQNGELMLLHPLPRGAELPADFDRHVRSAYFRQARNGLWVREAVLGSLMGRL
jgi:aspartate carbamoyltransferase catalytic subunit